MPATDVAKHDMGEAGSETIRICDQDVQYLLYNPRISLFPGSIHGFWRKFRIYFMSRRIDLFGGKSNSGESSHSTAGIERDIASRYYVDHIRQIWSGLDCFGPPKIQI